MVEYRLIIPQDRWVEYRLIIPHRTDGRIQVNNTTQDRWVEYWLIIPQYRIQV